MLSPITRRTGSPDGQRWLQVQDNTASSNGHYRSPETPRVDSSLRVVGLQQQQTSSLRHQVQGLWCSFHAKRRQDWRPSLCKALPLLFLEVSRWMLPSSFFGGQEWRLLLFSDSGKQPLPGAEGITQLPLTLFTLLFVVPCPESDWTISQPYD